ncbi:pollen-specific leucine-rich repeat extensin-like protein 2 [Penaeus monodon]|uniref:pollen-specific leucine-rich repeat extensin-like protein 2 n=1 Tax=Penaeus monodon TaxID=6687 RepID=UPI0018A7A35A|nr:pollen-specific leucine-rich repeat extensin-like protein 2 [Penaeus monodon]
MTDMPKTSTLEYKAGLHSPSLHSPVKSDPQKAMEGYNVPFGGGLPAPVLPVRNNLRRPGPGRVGGSSSSAGRGGQGSPHCSWRCTAIIFITIAVVLGAILIYIAATSTLAWSPHGGCAVLVDDASVINDDSHLGQAASRGNPQRRHRGHRGRQGASQWRPHGPALVYEVLGEMPWPPEDPPGSPSPSRPLQSRRMRRSVSHDELESQPSPPPPSMDLDSPPPLAPSSPSSPPPPSSSSSSAPPSPSPVLTPGNQPHSTTLTHSLPDASPPADSPPSSTNFRDSHESPTFADSNPDVSPSLPSPDSPPDSPSHTDFPPSDREANRHEEAPTSSAASSSSSSLSSPLHVPLAPPDPLTPSMAGGGRGRGAKENKQEMIACNPRDLREGPRSSFRTQSPD